MRTLLLALVALSPASAAAAESICYGTPSNGRLEHGVQLSESGANFEPYSSVGVSLGRTYVHSKVANVVSAAYSALTRSAPGVQFVYGESGWEHGGRIRPHRTHQNGLAVDFMVPIRDRERRSVALPSAMTNKFGYGIEFDSRARFENLTIDFDAIAEHLYALHQATKAEGIKVERVIFDPAFIPKLYETKRGDFIRANISFMKGHAWVRHDEHYHVDFSVSCRPMKK